MFLKSLTIKGFKSFADTTVLDFEPGVTVVVGPNGSGKSNVVDAIAWVLGAQGPRTVRSQKMDDVVFAGTANRPALGRAEVSMVLDNTAGLLPVEFNEVTISRVLYRSGDSEYSLNGVACRLLDIQELLSDAGVGRQQHIIIAQGQIDQALNARPEERRLIVEEAAGILKYRRRKERAQRRLDATEANLLRLQDLQREVRRQLRPLEQQADAARRHGDVLAELRALKLYLAGRELRDRRQRLEASESERARLREDDAKVRAELAELDVRIVAAEARLAAVGDDVGDALPRYESLRERCLGLTAVLAERRRGLERDRSAALADDLVASLEAERAGVRHQLTVVEEAAVALTPEVDQLVEREEQLVVEQKTFDDERDGFIPDVSGRAAEVRGQLRAIRDSVARAERERARLDEKMAALETAQVERRQEADELRRRLAEQTEAEDRLVATLDAATEGLAEAESAASAASDAVRAATSEVDRWTTRSEALSLALDEVRANAGVERLDGVDGVVGTVADLVEIDAGFEQAFEAAVGEAMASVVVRDGDAARRALEHLDRSEVRGAVLALGGSAPTLPTVDGGVALRQHVRPVDAGAGPLVDRLVGGAVVVDGRWSDALDLAMRHPDAIVVTTSGDRFGASGWRIGAGGSGATRAAHDEALAEVDKAREALDLSTMTAEAAGLSVAAATGARDDARRALDEHDANVTRTTEALERAERVRAEAVNEVATVRERHEELSSQLVRDGEQVAQLEAVLPELEEREQTDRSTADDFDRRRSDLDDRARAVAALRSDLGVRAAALEERREVLTARVQEIGERLVQHEHEVAVAAERRERLDGRLAAVDRLARFVDARTAVVSVELERLRAKRQATSEATRAVASELDGLRGRRSQLDGDLDRHRDALAKLDVADAELTLRLETLLHAIRTELDADPDAALAAEMPELPDGATAAGRVRELERDLKKMGPINPLALQEFETLKERHEFVSGQLDDVRGGRRELAKVIRAIDEEIVQIFAAAVADVTTNFEQLFSTLFPGGKGTLKLTEPGDLLNTGIELEAKPSGKNVRKLSLLSGGERSLTALAFLFAIFRSRPSPFYVMDEVEAALDDVNLHRFLDLVAEFRKEAQLVIVSHQKRTMEAADCLYGVTMPPGGSSRVVSEKIAS